MVDPFSKLRHRLQSTLRDCFGDDAGAIAADIQRSDHADYQADLASGLARQLRRDPCDIAAGVVEHLRPDRRPSAWKEVKCHHYYR